jgi:hypothetical protein
MATIIIGIRLQKTRFINRIRCNFGVIDSIVISKDFITFMDIDPYEMEERGCKKVDTSWFDLDDIITSIETATKYYEKQHKLPKYLQKVYFRATGKVLPKLRNLRQDFQDLLVCIDD